MNQCTLWHAKIPQGLLRMCRDHAPPLSSSGQAHPVMQPQTDLVAIPSLPSAAGFFADKAADAKARGEKPISKNQMATV